jgi:hypothetical protein
MESGKVYELMKSRKIYEEHGKIYAELESLSSNRTVFLDARKPIFHKKKSNYLHVQAH